MEENQKKNSEMKIGDIDEIKNKDDSEKEKSDKKVDKRDRFRIVKKVGIVGILGNILLVIIKGIVGFSTKSQAMIADFFNSAGDIFSSLMTFIGNKIASKPHDKDHNLGHEKAEYIFSMYISIAMMYTSLMVIKDSIKELIHQESYSFSMWLFVVSGVTIIIKMSLFLYTWWLGKRINNLLIEANSKDHRNDCVIALLTFLSSVLGYFGIFYIDGIIGIIISTWILFQGCGIFKEAYDVLMDKSIENTKKNEILKIIKLHPEIKKITHFNSTPIGYQYQISFSIFVDGNLSTFESHKIADKLEKEINDRVEEVYLTVIHVNPI